MLDHPTYLAVLNQLEADGWRVAQTEWHHTEFRPGSDGWAPRSIISFEIHATNQAKERRAAIKGQLDITWTDKKTNTGLRIPDTIQIVDTSITDYTGQPAFVQMLQVDTTQLDAKLYPRVSPVIVNDLNKDGQPELILAGSNLVYRKEGDNFQHIPFLDNPVIPLG